jgi:hypothetical protein
MLWGKKGVQLTIFFSFLGGREGRRVEEAVWVVCKVPSYPQEKIEKIGFSSLNVH